MEKQSPEIQMETQSVVIESSNASSFYYESTELAHGEESGEKEAHEEKACEISESRKLAHGKEQVVEEAHEEDDYAAPVSLEISLETQVLDPTWMTSIKEKCHLLQPRIIKASSTNISTSIHRVPHILFQRDENAYVPQVVSIGPLHYHKRTKQLQAVEEHKWRYLHEIVNRKGEACLEQCMMAVKKLEEEARECYSEVIDLDSKSFVEMMVLDGCFIVQLFHKTRFGQFEDDPLFKLQLLEIQLAVDLVKFENQIPFFILETLLDVIYGSGHSLTTTALFFFVRWPFYNVIQSNSEILNVRSKLRIHHLLHLLHENIVLSVEKEYPPSQNKCPSSEASKQIRCSSKLQESGIKFRARDLEKGAGHLFDIKFDKEKGIIEIPRIMIYDETNTMFRNLIAFEQCYLNDQEHKHMLTAYTYFMDCLINSSQDVEILVQKGIIENRLGCDEDVAVLFNNINKNVLLDPKTLYLSGVCEEINHYCGTPWPKLRATLVHDYFKNPWAVISFFAAVLLLLLTFTQALISVFPKFAIGN